jgi:DNA-binding beta-propeller fold protein YncE
VLTTVPIGDGPDGVAFDPTRREVISSNGADGTMTVVREAGPASYAVAQTVPTQRGARTIALDPTTHRLYTASAEFTPPPAPTLERPKPRPGIVPGTFTVLVIERK